MQRMSEPVIRTINRAMMLLGLLFLFLTALIFIQPQHAYAIILSDIVAAVLLVFLYLAKPEKKD